MPGRHEPCGFAAGKLSVNREPGDLVTVMRGYARTSRQAAALLAAGLLAGGCALSAGDGPPAAQRHGGTRPAVPQAQPTGGAVVTSPFTGLEAYLAHRSGEVTAALYDAETGHTWVLNPAQVQDTASIVKVQIMATALQEAEAVHQRLPRQEASLMAPMIENSDNQAATSLLADVGGPGALALFDRSASMNHTTPSTLALIPGTPWPGWGLTTTSALDEVTLISKFAYPNPLLSHAARRYGLSLMERVEADQDWGISGGVPRGTTVALKNGWLPLGPSDWQVNSIGWVRGHGRNYVLAVLTHGSPSEGYGIATIQTVARTVFTKLR